MTDTRGITSRDMSGKKHEKKNRYRIIENDNAISNCYDDNKDKMDQAHWNRACTSQERKH